MLCLSHQIKNDAAVYGLKPTDKLCSVWTVYVWIIMCCLLIIANANSLKLLMLAK